MGLLRILLEFLLVRTFLYDDPSSFVAAFKPVNFKEGTKMVTKCNADAIRLEPKYKLIFRATLYHLLKDQAKTPVEIAHVQHKKANVEASITKNQDYVKMGWNITTPQMSRIDNIITKRSDTRALLTIRLSKTYATCTINGDYKCVLKFDKDGTETEASGSFTYFVAGIVGIDSLTSVPNRPAGKGGNQKFYSRDEKVVLMCKAKGPKKSKLKWKWRCPYSKGLTNLEAFDFPKFKYTNPDGRDGGCNTYELQSALTFQAVHELRECEVACVFVGKENDIRTDEMRSVNMIIDTEKAESVTSKPAAEEQASDRSFIDVIRGANRVAVLAICSVILVVVFVPLPLLAIVTWARSRKKEKSDDVAEEIKEEQTLQK